MKIKIMIAIILFIVITMFLFFGCEEKPTKPVFTSESNNPNVFIDRLDAGLFYQPFNYTSAEAIEVDKNEKYKGTSSLKITVPNTGNPQESYAGGAITSKSQRNLSEYNAITFWGKASQISSIGAIGYGNDNTGNSLYSGWLFDLNLTTVWQKYTIPIPDPDKLSSENGLFFYGAGADSNGNGYNIWFDEIKFENLNTISILSSKMSSQINSALIGDTIDVGDVSIKFDVNGVETEIKALPGYITFNADNNSVVNISNSVITVIGSGTTTITAKLGGIDVEGFVTVNVGTFSGPANSAPSPTVPSDSVISLFSNAYNNHPGIVWNTYWQYSTASVIDVLLNGDATKLYTDLNFVGIEFVNTTIDASDMTYFHMDIWTPDSTAFGQTFKVQLVDFGPNGTFDGGDDTSHELTFTSSTSPALATQQWISIDVPLSDFIGLTTKEHLAWLVLSGDIPTVYVDNVYFYDSGSNGSQNGPTVAAPTPTVSASNVISLFSNVYTNHSAINWNTFWQFSTAVLTDVLINGDDAKLYTDLNFVGIEFITPTIDASNMTHFHMDIWTPDTTSAPAEFNVTLVDFGADGAYGGGDDASHELTFTESTTPALASKQWVSMDIPLSDFIGLISKGHMAQLILEGDIPTVYVDNVYFYEMPSEPSVAAPTPTYASGDVISVFSDSYTNIPGTDLNPNWGQATVVTQPQIQGNNTLLYTGLNYQGIQLGSNQNLTAAAMVNLHLDFWTANSTALNVYLISPGPVETAFTLTVPTTGWSSVDIPLTAFAPVDLTDVIQLKFDGDGDIYLDNILWRK